MEGVNSPSKSQITIVSASLLQTPHQPIVSKTPGAPLRPVRAPQSRSPITGPKLSMSLFPSSVAQCLFNEF